MSKLRALLTDLDGTLADTSGANAAAYVAALAEFGVVVSTETLTERAAGRHWRDFLPALMGVSPGAAECEAVAARKRALYGPMLATVPVNWPLVHLIRQLRGNLRVGLVTTASRSGVSALLVANRLAGLFDVVVCGEDVERHKPDPAAYILAGEKLGVRPDECLVFEDSLAGRESAYRFGARVVHVEFGAEDTRRAGASLPEGVLG